MSQEACPRCGETDWVAGALESTGQIRFRPVQTRFFTFRTGDINIRARMCSACGYLDLTGDTGKLHHIHREPAHMDTPIPSVP